MRKEDPAREVSGPEVQCGYQLMTEIAKYDYKDKQLAVQAKAVKRLMKMVESGTIDDGASWIRCCTVLPTFDKPGQPQKDKIILHFKGSIVLPPTVEAEEALQLSQAAAMGVEGRVGYQQTPLEMPVAMLRSDGGKIVEVERMIAVLWEPP